MNTKAEPETGYEHVTDEELFDMLREQVNLSRNRIGHNRTKTRKVALEASRRGWRFKKP